MGTLPSTRLLVTKNGIVLGEFDNYFSVGVSIGVSVTDEGVVFLNGEKKYPEYIYDPTGKDKNAYTSKREIISDWMRCYFKSNRIRIYRYLT